MNPPAIEKVNQQIAAVLELTASWDDWTVGRMARVLLKRMRSHYPSHDGRLAPIDAAAVLIDREFGWTGDEPDTPTYTNEEHAFQAVERFLRHADDDTRRRLIAKIQVCLGPREPKGHR